MQNADLLMKNLCIPVNSYYYDLNLSLCVQVFPEIVSQSDDVTHLNPRATNKLPRHNVTNMKYKGPVIIYGRGTESKMGGWLKNV